MIYVYRPQSNETSIARDYLSEIIIKNGVWENTQIRSLFWAINLVRENHPNSEVLFIDIGANLGYYSLSAASLGYKVIAFEPMQ